MTVARPAASATPVTPAAQPVAKLTKEELAPKPAPHAEAVKEPEEAAKPATPATPATPVISNTADAAEIWNQILLHVQEKAPSIYKMLEDSGYTIKNNVITIYSKKKFAKAQITKRIPILAEILPNEYTIEVNDQTLNQDADMAAIAELMGGGEEVQIDA
jgi:hypothetical protein